MFENIVYVGLGFAAAFLTVGSAWHFTACKIRSGLFIWRLYIGGIKEAIRHLIDKGFDVIRTGDDYKDDSQWDMHHHS
jgi:hypothetical protein